MLGSTDFINKAKRMRKALGGGMRQSGILAAAAMVALDDFEAGMLSHDHKKAQQLADAIKGIHIIHITIPLSLLLYRPPPSPPPPLLLPLLPSFLLSTNYY